MNCQLLYDSIKLYGTEIVVIIIIKSWSKELVSVTIIDNRL